MALIHTYSTSEIVLLNKIAFRQDYLNGRQFPLGHGQNREADDDARIINHRVGHWRDMALILIPFYHHSWPSDHPVNHSKSQSLFS
jgi:hypothetical protein